MKKFLFALVIACLAFGAQAQIIQSTSSKSTIRVVPEEKKSEDWNHSSAFIETGIGVTAGDCVNDFGWTVGIGYRWHIAQGVYWDIIKMNFNTGASHFTDLLAIRFTSGVRYHSPRFIAGKALYANFDLGYDYATGVEGGGFAYEIGAGFVLNKHVSLGLVWEGNSAKWEDSYYGDWYEFTSKWGMFGVKFGVQF